MNPNQIPPQLLALLLQNPEWAQKLQAGGLQVGPQGGQGGMPPPAGGAPMGMVPQGMPQGMPMGGGMPPRPY